MVWLIISQLREALSAGFLGAPDEARLNKVKQQRNMAEQAVSSLELLIASEQKYLDLGFVEKLSLLQAKLNQRKSIRDQIDQIQEKDTFLYYSQINRLANRLPWNSFAVTTVFKTNNLVLPLLSFVLVKRASRTS